jgi:hypothetical protein
MDGCAAFPYLTGLLNRMTNPAIAAATLLIRHVQSNRPAAEPRIFLLCR